METQDTNETDSYIAVEYKHQDVRPNHGEIKKVLFKMNLIVILEENLNYLTLLNPINARIVNIL